MLATVWAQAVEGEQGVIPEPDVYILTEELVGSDTENCKRDNEGAGRIHETEEVCVGTIQTIRD